MTCPGRWQGAWSDNGNLPAFRVSDDFADGSVDTAQWSQFAFGSVVGAEGAGTYTFSVDTSGTGGASLFTRSRYDITGDVFASELIDAGTQQPGLQAYPAEFQIDSNNRIFISVSNGFIGAWQTVAGVTANHGFTAYVPADHRWFRLRESAGVTYWEVGADGITWSTLASAANPIPTTDVVMLIATDTFLTLPGAEDVIFGAVAAPVYAP